MDRFHALAGELRETEAALSHTVQLMGATVDFAKTRPVFDGYKAARYSRKYGSVKSGRTAIFWLWLCCGAET